MKKRIEKLYDIMDKNDINCSVIAKPENIYYFSGFYPTQISFAIIPSKGDPKILVTPIDSKGAEEKSIFEIIEVKSEIFWKAKSNIEKSQRFTEGKISFLKAFLKKLSSFKKCIGIEEDFLSIRTYKNLGIHLKRYKDISSSIIKLRSIKDNGEIENIKKAIKISEKGLRDVADLIQAGKTEEEIASEIDYATKKHGSHKTHILQVAAGKNSSKPHWRASNSAIKIGEPFIIDFCIDSNRYCSDISRTFYLGEPPKEFENICNALLDAQNEGIKSARVGEKISKVDDSVRKILEEYGYNKYFIHPTGHGIGLEIHEYPTIAPVERNNVSPEDFIRINFEGLNLEILKDFMKLTEDDEDGGEVLKENMVITIEPGIYLENFGVRVEDIVLVKKKPEVLSSFAKFPVLSPL